MGSRRTKVPHRRPDNLGGFVAKRCGRNFPLNCWLGGRDGGIAERRSCSGDIATTARLPGEAVFRAKLLPLPTVTLYQDRLPTGPTY